MTFLEYRRNRGDDGHRSQPFPGPNPEEPPEVLFRDATTLEPRDHDPSH